MILVIDIPDHLLKQAEAISGYTYSSRVVTGLIKQELGAAAGQYSGNASCAYEYELLKLFRLSEVKVKGV